MPKLDAERVLDRVNLARQHAAAASKVSFSPKAPISRNAASRAADKLGTGLYVNIAQSVPGLIALLTPAKLAESVSRSKKGLGTILPDHKYIGPGNPMNLGLPVDDGDALAYLHDEAYDRLLKSGVDPKFVYGGISEADNDAIEDSKAILRNHPDVGALAVLLGIGSKQGASKMIQDLLRYVPQALKNKIGLKELKSFYPDPVIRKVTPEGMASVQPAIDAAVKASMPQMVSM